MDAIEDMINADEVERALWMIANVPAYYRDHEPDRLKEIRRSLHRQLYTPVQYKGIYDGSVIDHERMLWPLRSRKTTELVQELNSKDIVPNIMELAPGGHWMAHGMAHRGCKFTYEFLDLDGGETPFTKPLSAPAFNIFIAFEVIEHLSNEWEVYQNYLKFERPADVVMISCPLYTYSGGMDDWRNRALGHLRAYTPNELHAIVSKMFQGFNWECVLDDTIVLTGRKA